MRKLIETIEFSLMLHPRYKHSKGVIDMAKRLNAQYHLGINEDKITLAGLLHDVTKNYSNEEQLEILNDFYHYKIDDELLSCPSIWHAVTARVVSEKRYHLIDEEILNAIMYHTTGRPKMGDLEKLIFLCDYIEEGRTGHYFEDVRHVALEKGICEAIVQMYENVFLYLKSQNQNIYSLSLKAYEYYKKEVKND